MTIRAGTLLRVRPARRPTLPGRVHNWLIAGFEPTTPPTQIRTWNLSSLWRVPAEGQVAWLKVVPDFFAHEGALLAAMAGAQVPVLLGHDGGRMLLAEIAGEDQHDAQLPQLLDMVTRLVDLQGRWGDRVEELLALGLPDWRAPALGAAITDVIERTRDEIPVEDRAMLADFVRRLPDRFDDVDACGLRDTLVHGDFHPGNFRGDGRALTLLDWGDSGVGHPLLDHLPFSIRFRTPASTPCGRTGCNNGAQPFPVRIPPAHRSCLPRSPPHGRPSSIETFSTTSNRPSRSTTVPIRRSG